MFWLFLVSKTKQCILEQGACRTRMVPSSWTAGSQNGESAHPGSVQHSTSFWADRGRYRVSTMSASRTTEVVGYSSDCGAWRLGLAYGPPVLAAPENPAFSGAAGLVLSRRRPPLRRAPCSQAHPPARARSSCSGALSFPRLSLTHPVACVGEKKHASTGKQNMQALGLGECRPTF